MNDWAAWELRGQLERLRAASHLVVFRAVASRFGFPLPLWLSIASRETDLENKLGDWRDGEYHGVGYVQVDVQHPLARKMRDDGSWRLDPAALLLAGAQVLVESRAAVRQALPLLVGDPLWKAAVAGYNCGPERAIEGHREHGDCDHFTTGKDYGRDVLARGVVFDGLLQVPS